MGFIDIIIEHLGGVEGVLNPQFRAVLFGKSAVYLENIIGIVSYEKEEILLCVKKGKVRIKGQNLYVKKYCLGDMVICGKITCVESVENQ